MRSSPPASERLSAPLARAYLRRQNARAVARLKALLERGAPHLAADSNEDST
jgi:hypothetical protein